jgi:pyruvate,orthophosphate dikinase
MGKCCVAGCGDLEIDYEMGAMTVNGKTFKAGDWISLNGSTGEVFEGQIPTIEPLMTGDFAAFMKWADRYRRLKIRTNADTPYDSKVGRGFGAEGIGLCRTEHMFFEEDRIFAMRQMILAETKEGREEALKLIIPMQQGDFDGIFKEMDGLPVTIRLLDPPLHEFLPHTEKALRKLARKMNVTFEDLSIRNKALTEANPMLGHRGCRLGITYPEIYDMQVKAIMEAACNCRRKNIRVQPEIMIPLISDVRELSILKERAIEVANSVLRANKMEIKYSIGTMIELPRAALTAGKIAEEAEFFSFGTNDLTQTTYGLSRDDATKFLMEYVDRKVFTHNPFISLDQIGVGRLIKLAVQEGREIRPNLKVGICGEHGGEPSSVEFCHGIGMDYVSCSPYRVPIARLAAAHAAIKEAKTHKAHETAKPAKKKK